MSVRSMCWPFVALLVLLISVQSAFAATVTVNAAAAAVPGSIYNTIRDAANDLTGLPWGDGVDDTILVTDDAVIIETDIVTIRSFAEGGSVTVKANPGDNPVIALTDFPPPTRLFRVNSSMSVTFDGLICIGAAATNPRDAGIRTAFWFEADSPGVVVNATIKNCVVTKNKGNTVETSEPEMDFSAPFTTDDPATLNGSFMRFIYHGDDPYRGMITCNIENCVFAFFNTDYAALHFDRQVAPDNPFENPTRTLTIKNTLITKVVGDGHIMRARDVGPETTYNFIDSCLTDCTGRGLLFGRNDLPQIGMHLNITHSIIDSTGGSSPINIDGLWIGGSMNLDSVTLARPGADMIVLEQQQDGENDITLKNIISVAPDDSVFRLLPAGGTPHSFTVSNINTDGAAARDEQSDAIKNAFLADYGGTGPFPDDPMFVSTDIDSSYTGIRKWDSTTNTLYDVNNSSFTGKGTGGTNLVGGAECPACSATGVDDWSLY